MSGSSGIQGQERRRTHPWTPLVHAAQAIPAVFGLLIVFGFGATKVQLPLPVILLLSVAIAALIAGFAYLAWSRTTYFFDAAGDLRVDSGVISRSERRIALSRLQSVEVIQPLVARLVGMAMVTVEAAGSGDSRLTLSFLKEEDARALRAEIMARAAGIRPDAGEAPEVALVQVPAGDLALSLAIRSETIFLALFTALLFAVAILTAGLSGLLTILFGGVPLLAVFSEFTKYFNFTVSESPDGLRLRHGLIQTETRTVPPNRVHAIEFYEPLLWRRRNWVRVRLNLAGLETTAENGQQQVEQVLIPVAPWEVATSLVARVMPGVDLSAVDWNCAPEASRRRSPFQWRNLAVAHNDQVFLARRGFFTRRIEAIPHARNQSVRVTQGPWERRLGLASMHVDTVPGPVRISGLRREEADARRVAEEQVVRAGAARAAAPPERWLSPDTADSADAATQMPAQETD